MPIFWTTDGMLENGFFLKISRPDLKQNKTISLEKYIWICYVQNSGHIYQALMC